MRWGGNWHTLQLSCVRNNILESTVFQNILGLHYFEIVALGVILAVSPDTRRLIPIFTVFKDGTEKCLYVDLVVQDLGAENRPCSCAQVVHMFAPNNNTNGARML